VRTADVGLTGSANWLAFSADGKTVVSSNLDGTVTVWDVANASPREILSGHARGVQQPVFSRDGTTLYTASSDGTAIAWDMTGNRRFTRPFTFTHDRDFDEGYDLHPGRFSPDGRLIATGLKKQGVQLWNASDLTRSGAPLLATGEFGGEVKALAFSPDGKTLAALTGFGELTLWDVRSRTLRRELAVSPGALAGVVFSPDGTKLLTSGADGITLWNVRTGAGLGSFGLGSDLALTPDGTLVASGLEVWDVATRKRVASMEADPEADELSVAFSPNGLTVAVGGYGRFVRLWDVKTRTLVHELDTGGTGATALEFSADGSVLAVSGFEPVATLWDVATGTQIGSSLTAAAGRRTAMVDLSIDGKHLLMTAANGEGAVWDIDPESWARRACALANRTLTREEWKEFLPGRPYEPACR
jgi:WD40 repeat protein